MALAAAPAIAGLPEIVILSGGTDGTDGPTDAAGLNARRHLDGHDAYPFFERLGDLLVTGPTRTNVMDLCVVLVDKPADRCQAASLPG